MPPRLHEPLRATQNPRQSVDLGYESPRARTTNLILRDTARRQKIHQQRLCVAIFLLAVVCGELLHMRRPLSSVPTNRTISSSEKVLTEEKVSLAPSQKRPKADYRALFKDQREAKGTTKDVAKNSLHTSTEKAEKKGSFTVRAEGGGAPFSAAATLTSPIDPVYAEKDTKGKLPSGPIKSTTSEYAKSTVRDDWKRTIAFFLRGIPREMCKDSVIIDAFENDSNNIQGTSMLVRIRDGKMSFTEKYKKGRHGRASSVKYILSKIATEKGTELPNTTFLVMLSDGHRPRVPTFGSARHWTSWNMLVPAPLGNSRGHSSGWGTPIEGWDEYVAQKVVATHKNYPWDKKIKKAVFRGSLVMQTHKLGSCNAGSNTGCQRAERWDEINRGVLFTESQKRLDLFNVAFSQHKMKNNAGPDQFRAAPGKGSNMDFVDFQKFRYVLNVGSNQDWSERLRLLLYMNSAVVNHMAETQEFFSPLLKPWIHYIPAQVSLSDIGANVEWATNHDEDIQQIVRNQQEFARRYITERSMQLYWEILIAEFGKLQRGT